MLPPGGRVRQKTYLAAAPVLDGVGLARLTPYQEQVLEYVRGRERVEEGRLVEALGQRARAAALRLSEAGLVVRSQRWAGRAVGRKTTDYVRLVPRAGDGLAEEVDRLAGRWPRRAALLSRLAENGGAMVISAARKEYGGSAVQTLLRQGRILKETVAQDRGPARRIRRVAGATRGAHARPKGRRLGHRRSAGRAVPRRRFPGGGRDG